MRTGPGPKADGGVHFQQAGRPTAACAPAQAGRPTAACAPAGRKARRAHRPRPEGRRLACAPASRKADGGVREGRRRRVHRVPGRKADGGVRTGPGPKADGGGCPSPHVSRPTTARARRARPAHSRRSRMSTPRGPSAPRREAWTQTGRFATVHVPASRQLRVRRKSVDKNRPGAQGSRPTPTPPRHPGARALALGRHSAHHGTATCRPRPADPSTANVHTSRSSLAPPRSVDANRPVRDHSRPDVPTAPRPAEKRGQKSARRPPSGGPPRHAPPAQDPRRPRTPAGPGPPPAQDPRRPRTPPAQDPRRPRTPFGSGPPQAQDPRSLRTPARRGTCPRPAAAQHPPGHDPAQPLCGATDHSG